MTKKTNPNVFIALGGVLALVFTLYAFFPTMFFLSGTGGLTVNSISQANIIVNGEQVSGQYRITATANSGAESITGISNSVTPTDLKSQAGVTYDPKNSFTIGVSSLSEKVNYAVSNTASEKVPIWRHDPVAATECDTAIGWGTPGVKGNYIRCNLAASVLCLKRVQVGWTSVFGAPKVESGVKVYVLNGADNTVAGQATISSNSPSSVLGNIGQVSWTGYLSTGNAPPLASLYKPYWMTSTPYWKIASNTIAESYRNDENTRWTHLTLCATQVLADVKTSSDIYNWNTNHLNPFAATNIAIGSIEAGSSYKKVTGQTWTGQNTQTAVLSVKPDYTIGYPQLVFTLDASWIGIKISVGKPVIVSGPTSGEFASGSRGNIAMTVKNDAPVPASFSIALDGCTRFYQDGSLTGVQFAANENKVITNFYVRTTGSAAATSETCNVKVCEMSGRGGCVSSPVFISMSAARYCDEGAHKIEANCHFVCQNNQFVQQSCCQTGTTMKLVNGEYICETPPSQRDTIICPIGQVLKNGVCVSTTCSVDADCDDKDACTVDKCLTNILGVRYCENKKIENCVGGVQFDFSLIFTALAAVLTAIGIYAIKRPRKNEKTFWAIIGIVAGLIVGMMVWWVLQVQWWQWILLGGGLWLAVLVGVVIFAALGLTLKVRTG